MPAKPKRIVIVTHYFPPHVGGIEMVAREQAERLVAQGHTVTVVTSKVSRAEHCGFENGVRIWRVLAFNGLEKFGVPFPIFAPTLVPVLWHAISRADVVHVHDATYQPCATASVIAAMLGKPVVLTQHVGIVQHPSGVVRAAQRLLHGTLGAMVYKMSRTVFTLNDRVERHVRERGAKPSAIQALVNGVDTSLFQPVSMAQKRLLRAELGLSEDRPIVLFVGRFVPKKGFTAMVAARDDAYQLVFAGGDTRRPSTKQTVFLGRLPQDKLAQVYQAADVFVLPSEGEGFPLSVQEAMATGLPIITAHDDGYARYKLDPALVTLLRSTHPHTIKLAIKAVLGNGHLRQAMAMYSREYAHANFSWEQVIRHLEFAYEGATSEAAA